MPECPGPPILADAMNLVNLLLMAFIGSSGALVGPMLFWIAEPAIRRGLPFIVSLATGTMLGAALLGLLPEAIEGLGAHDGFMTVLAGILIFFIIEKIVRWEHSHEIGETAEPHTDDHVHATGPIVLISDGFHNLLDGLIIGAAMLESPALGLAAAVAVFAHEIPQEIGDFAILVHSGMKPVRAFMLNYLSAMMVFAGAVTAYYLLKDARALMPWVHGIAGASFLYVAMADLVPALNREVRWGRAIIQVMLVIAGATFVYFMRHPH